MNKRSVDGQIRNLMQERRKGFDRYTRKLIPNQENYMKGFEESYYLSSEDKSGVPDTYSASGKLNDNELRRTFHNNVSERRKTLRDKALELESLIVDSMIRENYQETMKLFRTLAKMKMKFSDDNVNDIFLRVQAALPRKASKKN